MWQRSEVRQRRALRRQKLRHLTEERKRLLVELDVARQRATGIMAWLDLGARAHLVAKLEGDLEVCVVMPQMMGSAPFSTHGHEFSIPHTDHRENSESGAQSE